MNNSSQKEKYTSKYLEATDLKSKIKFQKKLYKLFLKTIDESTRDRLIGIDKKLSKSINNIYKQTGWNITPMFATKEFDKNIGNICIIPRDATSGFYLRNYDNRTISKEIIAEEFNFYNKYYEYLNSIHLLFKEKNNILSGKYNILNPTYDNKEFCDTAANILRNRYYQKALKKH